MNKKSDRLSSNETLKVSFIGTSEIGKSGSLQTLLIFLVHEAQEKGVIYSIRLKVLISERSPSKERLLRTDGHSSPYEDENVDYFLSNSAFLCEHCVCPTSESKQFEKLQGRILRPMPVWTCDELLQIFPFSNDETVMRYAIFGGSARHFLGSETMDWFLKKRKQRMF